MTKEEIDEQIMESLKNKSMEELFPMLDFESQQRFSGYVTEVLQRLATGRSTADLALKLEGLEPRSIDWCGGKPLDEEKRQKIVEHLQRNGRAIKYH
jgi:hypothetical protein